MDCCKEKAEAIKELIREREVKPPVEPIKVIKAERHEFELEVSEKGVKVSPKPEIPKKAGVYFFFSFNLFQVIQNSLSTEGIELLKKVIGDIVSSEELNDPLLIVGESKNLKKRLEEEFFPTLERGLYSHAEAGRLRELLKVIYALRRCKGNEEALKLNLCLLILQSEQHAQFEKQFLSLKKPLLNVKGYPPKDTEPIVYEIYEILTKPCGGS